MTVDALIMLGGVLVALLPFLGFPNSWDRVIFFILGALVVALGIVVRRRHGIDQTRRSARKQRAVYAQSAPPESEISPFAHEEVAQ